MKTLEASNAFLCVLSLGLSFIFMFILYDLRKQWTTLRFGAAASIFLFNVGIGLRQLIFLIGRRLYPEDVLWTVQGPQFTFVLFTLGITAIGLLYQVRVFSQHRFGHGPWVGLLAVATMAAMFSYWL